MKRFVALLVVLAFITLACSGEEASSPPAVDLGDGLLEPAPRTPLEVARTTPTVVTTEQIFAEPAGTTIGEATTPLEVQGIMRSIRGDTDDFASTVARLSPFPDIPALSNSTLSAVRVELNQDFDEGREVADFEQSTNVTVWTDATSEDVLRELSTALPASGFEFDGESSISSRTVLTHGDFDTGRISSVVSNTDEDGQTRIDIGYSFWPDQPMIGIISDHADWIGDALLTDSITSISMQVNDLPNYEVDLTHIYWDTNSEDAEAQFLLGLGDNTFVERPNIDGPLQVALFPDTPGIANLEWFERDDSSLQLLSFEGER